MFIPNILVIEASGFGQNSYPIEIGAVLDDGRKFCDLIRPQAHWTHWDPTAEKSHQISRNTLLEQGRPLLEVVQELNQLLAGRTVYTDTWGLDMPWLTKLFAEAGTQPDFRLESIDRLLSYTQQTIWHETLALVKSEYEQERRRASLDAEIVQLAYIRAAKLISRSNVRRRAIH